MKLNWQPPGMSREECERLRADLEAAGIPVVRVEEPVPGVLWLVFCSPALHIECAVKDVEMLRETTAAGPNPALPADTFGHRRQEHTQ